MKNSSPDAAKRKIHENFPLHSLKSPSIAVVFPNWNDSRYLRTCLRSILDQEVPPDELLIVDDHSSDDSVAIIRESIAGYPWARLIANEANIGANRSVAVALENISSDYVLTLSSNDFVLPGLFGRAKECLSRHPGSGIWSAMTCFADETDRIIGLHPSPVISFHDAFFSPAECSDLAIKFGSWFASNTMVFRRKTLLEIGGFNHDYKGLSDMLAALVVACREGAVFSPAPFGVLRIHPGGLLEKSLESASAVDSLLQTIGNRGPGWEPALFAPKFLKRLARRLYFANVRVSKGVSISTISPPCGAVTRVALRLIGSTTPESWGRLRVALAFLLLRPFDVAPTLWYRIVMVWLVRLRMRFYLEPKSRN